MPVGQGPTAMCDENDIQELLPAYLERSLDPDSSIRVEQHLASCEDCRTELALLRVLADEPIPALDEAFWSGMPDRIYREIQANEQQEKKRFALSDLLGWIFMPRMAWATAAVIVIAAVSLLTVRSVSINVARTDAAIEDFAAEQVNLDELSSEEFAATTQWAQNKFAPIEEAISIDTQDHTSRDISEDLSGLTDRELDRVYEMLKKKEQDAQEKLQKKTGNEKRLG